MSASSRAFAPFAFEALSLVPLKASPHITLRRATRADIRNFSFTRNHCRSGNAVK